MYFITLLLTYILFYSKICSKKSIYPILVDILRTSANNQIFFLPVTQHNGMELGHHFSYMAKAQENGLVYCPASKGTLHDGCLYDRVSDKIVEFAQFKLTQPGGRIHYKTLTEKYIPEKYAPLDTLMYGFKRTEDYITNNPLLIRLNEIQIDTNSSLAVIGKDLSIFSDPEKINVPHVEDLIARQIEHNSIVLDVNNFLKKNIKCGLDYTTNRSLNACDGKTVELVDSISSNFMGSELAHFISSNPDTLELANQIPYMF